METAQFFVDQHEFVEGIVRDFVLGGLSDEQLRACPREGQNSLAWLLWHAARWEDVVVNAWIAGRPQVIDEGGWPERLRLSRRDIGTAMTAAECTDFNAAVDVAAVRDYWQAVGERSRAVVRSLDSVKWGEVIDETRLRRATADGAVGNARAAWLDQFFAQRTTAWLLAFLNVHNAEHIIGEALSVRGQAGVPLGL